MMQFRKKITILMLILMLVSITMNSSIETDLMNCSEADQILITCNIKPVLEISLSTPRQTSLTISSTALFLIKFQSNISSTAICNFTKDQVVLHLTLKHKIILIHSIIVRSNIFYTNIYQTLRTEGLFDFGNSSESDFYWVSRIPCEIISKQHHFLRKILAVSIISRINVDESSNIDNCSKIKAQKNTFSDYTTALDALVQPITLNDNLDGVRIQKPMFLSSFVAIAIDATQCFSSEKLIKQQIYGYFAKTLDFLSAKSYYSSNFGDASAISIDQISFNRSVSESKRLTVFSYQNTASSFLQNQIFRQINPSIWQSLHQSQGPTPFHETLMKGLLTGLMKLMVLVGWLFGVWSCSRNQTKKYERYGLVFLFFHIYLLTETQQCGNATNCGLYFPTNCSCQCPYSQYCVIYDSNCTCTCLGIPGCGVHNSNCTCKCPYIQNCTDYNADCTCKCSFLPLCAVYNPDCSCQITCPAIPQCLIYNILCGCQLCTSIIHCDYYDAICRCSGGALGYYGLGYQTFPCLTNFTNCRTCISTQCTSCPNSTLAVNQTSGQCESCSTALTDCILCNGVDCSVCANYTGIYVNGTQSCKPCTFTNAACLLCDRCDVCTQCIDVSYFISSGICTPCSWMAHCLNCTNGPICTQCVDDTYYALNDTCVSCTTLTECTNCNSSTICTSCKNTSFLFSTHVCIICHPILTQCQTCHDIFTCTSCIDNTYYLDLTAHSCQPCNTNIPRCTNCNNNLTCIQCTPNFAYLNTSDPGPDQCPFCNQTTPGCSQCLLNTICTVCEGEYYITSHHCTCRIGWPINYPHCTNIVGCLTIQTIALINFCTSCDISLDFHFQPINNTCVCEIGTLVTGICTNIFGCIALRKINNIKICQTCNISLLLKPSNGVCQCIQYYEFDRNTNTCQDICGDGHILKNQCDDGNTISGDGCSSTCKVEDSYKCVNGTVQTPSVCIFIGKLITIQILSIIKDSMSDRGYFTFGFSPNISSILSKMNFTLNNTILKINSTYSVESMEFKDGELTLGVPFTQDLEGLPTFFEISYNSNLINLFLLNFTNRNNTSTCSFEAVSDTIPLRVSKNYSIMQVIDPILNGLAYFALATFLVGSFFRKMIGVESLYVFQLFFFYQIFVKNYSLEMSQLNSFKATTNWYYFPAYKHEISSMTRVDDGIYKYFTYLNRLDLNQQFAENMFINNLIEIILILLFCIVQFIKMLHKIKYDQIKRLLRIEKQKQQKKEEKLSLIELNQLKKQKDDHKKSFLKTLAILKTLYDHVFFPFFIGFLIQIMFCFSLSCLRLPELYQQLKYSSIFHKILNSGLIFMSLCGVAVIIGVEAMAFFVSNNKKIKNNQSQKPLYCIVFIIFMMFTGIIMIAFVFFNNVLSKNNIQILVYLMFAVNLLYFIFVVVYRPYTSSQSVLHNFSIILNQFIVLAFSGVFAFEYLAVHIYSSTYFFSEDIQILILYSLVGSLISVQIFTLVRIVFEIKSLYQKWSSRKMSESNPAKIESKNEKIVNNSLNLDEKKSILKSKKQVLKKKVNHLQLGDVDDEFKEQKINKISKGLDYIEKNINLQKKEKGEFVENSLINSNHFLKTQRKKLHESFLSYLKKIEDVEEI